MAATALGISCLTQCFSALLPPNDENDQEYYAVMGLNRTNASSEDIRKAYKKKSLELHPDKVAQRGGDADGAAAEYQHVQEANAVLSNAKKRRTYHALGCNPTRYKFVSSKAYHNPTVLYQNLAQATCAAKSRIVLLVAILLTLVLLQPILIVVKINHDLQNEGGALQDTPWTVILIPWWIAHGSIVAMLFFVFITAQQEKCTVFCKLFEQVCWLAWEVLLAVRWDNTVDWNYVDIFVPFYLVILLRIYQPLAAMKRIRTDCNKMISIQYLEQHVLDEGRNYQDLTDQEQEELQQDYILVHNADVMFEDVDEDDLEEARIHASPEFHRAMDVYYESFSQLINTVLFMPPFCVLLVLRLDDHIDVSWWVVFIPIWVHLGWRLLSSMWMCLCAPVSGEEVVIGAMEVPSDGEEDGNEEEKDEKVRDFGSSTAFASAEGEMSQFNEADESKKTSVEARDLESSTVFAPVEGDMAQDNEVAEMKRNIDAPDEEKAVPENQTDTSGDNSKDESSGAGKDPVTQDDSMRPAPDMESEDVIELYSPDDCVSPSDADNEKDETNKDGDKEDDEFHIDPETFEAWQSAYEEAESSAMEAQSKALGTCCWVSLELTILCLLVGKLDQSYQQEEGEDVGYSAVWIIFPILLLAGLVLCSCACLIYGASHADTMGESIVQEQDDEKIMIPSTVPDTAHEDEEEATSKPEDGQVKVDEEQGEGGYDADDID